MTDERHLTSGEQELAHSIFGGAINLAEVRLIHRRWWPLQPAGIVMAPMGNIHFHPLSDSWSENFSNEPLAAQGLFIHEMTHVFDAQTRGRFYLPLMRHPFCRYRYALQPGRAFAHYGIEQRAEIVRHAFLLRQGVHLSGVPSLADLEDLLPFDRPERTS